ncbi:anti-sigma factor family protein [Ramlibacter algicola]|uniref:Anti-sigma factor n=1 Tax=Ramlibacter algicola TaxID=2795217 RepID=A0A934Q364_9BURK|nr:hypothetical protein [Ramlibacter algicola]MBK0393696.1 hypothetical protein [Ramlibacter algicola]
MSWTDQDVTAFADGELEAGRASAFASDLAGDAHLQARVDAVRAQRSRIASAFEGVLREPVPDRLAALLGQPAANPVDRAPERRRRADAANSPRFLPPWATWGGMAASLVLGLAVGSRLAGGGSGDLVAQRDGGLVAAGPLARALETQLAKDAAGPVQVQLTFADKQGRYCRTFTAQRMAGLACREAGSWQVAVLAPRVDATTGGLRQAASVLPGVVLATVDAQAAGGTLDAKAEGDLVQRGWR